MAISYKLVKRGDPQTEGALVWTPSVVSHETLNYDDICLRIAKKSHLVTGDVEAIVRAILDQIGFYVMRSYSVNVGKLGCFGASVSTDQTDSPLLYTRSMIRKVNYTYRPSVYLKGKIALYTFSKMM